jgi:hypothetical protein
MPVLWVSILCFIWRMFRPIAIRFEPTTTSGIGQQESTPAIEPNLFRGVDLLEVEGADELRK